MNCQEMVEVIRSRDQARKEEAWEHIQQCPRCRKGFDNLARALLPVVGRVTPITCLTCSARLPEYLTATPEERATSAGLRAVWAHLAGCPGCRMEYENILNMLQAADGVAQGEVT